MSETLARLREAGQSTGAFGGLGPSECRAVADEIDRLEAALAAANERAEGMFTGKQVVDALHAVMPKVPKWDHPNDTNWVARLVIESLNDTPEPPATGANT